MAGFDISVLRDCIEGLSECRSQGDNESQQSADQLLALVDHSFSVLHEYVEECVDEDPVLTHSVYLLLIQLVKLWYESGALNETTLKTWRLFPKVLERHGGELDDRNALEFCRLLISYCSEGLDTLQVDTNSLGEGIELYLEQHNSTIKLIGFFTLRLLELLRYCSEQLRDYLPTALSLVLRYVSVLYLIGQHSNSVSSQAGKTLLYLRRAFQGHSVKDTVAATLLLCTTKSDISSSDNIYQTHVGVICCAIEYVEQYSVQISQSSEGLLAEDDVVIGAADVANWVDVFMNAMQSACIESTGLVDDGYFLALLQRMVVALANAMSLVTTELDLGKLIHASIRTERSKSNIARMLLTGVLTSFEHEAQVSLVQAVWQVCRAALLRCTCTAEVESVSLTLRSVLLVVESATARYELSCAILRFADISIPVTGSSSAQHMPQQDVGSAAVPQSVKERLLAELPVTYMLSQNEDDLSQRLLTSLLAHSVVSIESYAGAPGAASTTAGDSGDIEIGRALSILRASSGYRESAGVVGKAGQTGGLRQAREPIVRNISLGTAILRWISSLSQHIKILLPLPYGAGAAGTSSNSNSDVLNVHRLSRVDRLVDTLTAMVQCLWGHAVPRAVQTILAKAAQCCAETALSVLSYRVRADSEDMLVVTAVDKLLRGVANTLTVIANPSFSEKSVDAVKGVYAVWHRASSLCVQHPRATVSAYGWQELVRVLASLQRFANSLPVPLKPRARELVDPALVSVIQARALGRTFSLTRRCDVTDEAIANRHVPQALQIGVHELSVSGLHEETVVAASRPHLAQQNGSKSYDRDGTNTSAERPENTYYSDENKTCDINEAGYEEIDATAGTEGEMGREEKRDRDENESGNANEQEENGHLAKRQRSGTQGSNDDDDGGFADEFIY